MGNAASSECRLLSYDKSWEPRIHNVHFLHAKLPADAAAVILQHLPVASLRALACTSRSFHKAASEVARCFDEQVYKDICHHNGWSHSSLHEVGIHLARSPLHSERARGHTPCPPWLARLGARLSRPHYHHMRSGVVAKVQDAMGPIDTDILGPGPRARFKQRPSYRRLFHAHVKHNVAPGGDLINSADVLELRKLRGLQAYLYAEGWSDTETCGRRRLLESSIEHALSGRIDL